jgi:hypothetical protein
MCPDISIVVLTLMPNAAMAQRAANCAANILRYGKSIKIISLSREPVIASRVESEMRA